MKLGSVIKVFVCLAGIVQGSVPAYESKVPCVEIDGRVQCAAVETFANIRSLDYFAANQHFPHFQDPGYFIKKGSHFEWLAASPKEIPKNSLTCEETVYLTHRWTSDPLPVKLVSESAEPHLERSDCISLNKEIIGAHARVALQGKLPKENPYSEHLAWRCGDESCWPIGDLAWVNDLSEEHRRTVLINLPITVCLAVDLRKTDHSKGLYQTISATLFGTIPKKIDDICTSLFKYYFAKE